MKKRHKRKMHKHRHDFWRMWHEEGGDSAETPNTSPRQARAHRRDRWRKFFHAELGDFPENHWAIGGRRFSPWHQGEAAFNPFVANMLSKGGGLLPLLVLHLLAQAPRYGNELMERINEQTNGQWLANPGAIYPMLTMLEERGLVTGEWEDPRKRTVRRYQVTPRGKEELERMKSVFRPKLESAIDVLEKLADELGEVESY